MGTSYNDSLDLYEDMKDKLEKFKQVIINLMDATNDYDIQEIGGSPLEYSRDFALNAMDEIWPEYEFEE